MAAPTKDSVGPGTWYWLHCKGRDAVTDEGIRDFRQFLDYVARNFPCPNCRQHAQQFIRLNPLDLYVNVRNDRGELIGCFKYSWLMHNHANSAAGKPELDFETAYNMYYQRPMSSGVCAHGCDSKTATHQQSSSLSKPQQLSYRVQPLTYDAPTTYSVRPSIRARNS